ncbi:hypothetical protein BH10CYA1_BH10CYA1_32420 [soil metagenome]
MFEYTISILICLMSYPLGIFSAITTAKSAALWFPKQYVAIAMTTLFGNFAVTVFLHTFYFSQNYPLWLVPVSALALPPVAVLLVVASKSAITGVSALASYSTELIVNGMKTLKTKLEMVPKKKLTVKQLDEARVYVSFIEAEDDSTVASRTTASLFTQIEEPVAS